MIKEEDLNFLPLECHLKGEYVIFEKASKPSSKNGKGIPQGILLLTNKRLFFFSINEGKGKHSSAKVGAKVAVHISSEILNHFTLGLASFATSMAEYGIEKGIEHSKKEKNIDFIECSKKENSVVLSIQNIAHCEKFGRLFSLSKNRFTRITVINQYDKMDSYCIYGFTKDPQSFVKYEKWFEVINEIKMKINQ